MNQVRVLGVRVDCLDMSSALERIGQLVEAGGHHLVATVNPEFVMRARVDHEFARVLESAAAEGVAGELASRLRAEHSGLEVAAHAGSPAPSSDAETAAIISTYKPHVLLVAYGHPNQELWIDRNCDSLGVAVAMGVGGAFDYLTERVPRAPAWMRRAGLEWLFRLIRQPWRIRRMAVLPIYALRVLRNT